MKIGFSFGRCVRDIVTGKVRIDDVLLINARTRMDKVEDLDYVIGEYLNESTYLGGLDREECLVVARELYTSGRIHQPRTFGAWRQPVAGDYVWMDVVPTEITDNPAIKDAWESYQTVLKLGGDYLPPAYLAPRD